MLLAAGLGERLRPLTETVPKCLVPVAGKPTLVRGIELLRDQGITELIVNLHYRPDVVRATLGDGSALGVRIDYSLEPSLLGTGGALDRCRERLEGSRFVVLFADVVLACDLHELTALHERLGAVLTMTLYRRDDVRQSGWVESSTDGRVTGFVEKPDSTDPLAGLVNSGLMLCEPEVLEAVPRGHPSDLGRDVIPALLLADATVAGHRLGPKDLHLWIDTPADLVRAEQQLRAMEAVA